MDYIKQNKQAWEEAFEHRTPNWGEDNAKRLREETLPFFWPDAAKELQELDFRGKTVAQFCCNNGRELLSLMQLGAAQGVGFDIAENILAQAQRTAKQAGIENCEFVCGDILEMNARYHQMFDFIFFTIGAITWFEDVALLFQTVSDCLKPGGRLFIHDAHPFMNMLPFPDEEEFDAKHTNRIAYSYFRKEPWIETNGMEYISGAYDSRPFTSFSHTMASLVNAVCMAGMNVVKLNEYNYDIGLTEVYDDKGYPLSYILLAQKE